MILGILQHVGILPIYKTIKKEKHNEKQPPYIDKNGKLWDFDILILMDDSELKKVFN